MSNYKVKQFPIEIIKRGVLVFLGEEGDLLKYIKKHFPSYLQEVKEVLQEVYDYSALTIKLSGDAIIYSKDIILPGTLVHEIGHVAKHLLKCVDIEDEEMYCYTEEYLFEQIMSWLYPEGFKI